MVPVSLAGKCRLCCTEGAFFLTRWALIGLIVIAVDLQGSVLHAASGDAALLKAVSREHSANRERIRTWRGEIEVTAESFLPQGVPKAEQTTRQVSHGRVEFVCDCTTGSFRSNHVCTKNMGERDNGERVDLPYRMASSVMVVGDMYYHCFWDDAWDSRKDVPNHSPMGRVAIVRTASERPKPGAFRDEIDPFYWFTYDGEDTGELFAVYSGWVEEKADFYSRRSIEVDGDRVSLHIRSTGHNTYTIDRGQGSNLVEYDAADNDSGVGDRENWKYEYEEVGGVWVPKEVHGEVLCADNRRFARTLSWQKNVVNAPVEEAEFSIAKMGMRRGDLVQDERTGESYFVQGEEYAPAADSQSAVQPRGVSRVLFLIGGTIVVVLVVVLLLRRQ